MDGKRGREGKCSWKGRHGWNNKNKCRLVGPIPPFFWANPPPPSSTLSSFRVSRSDVRASLHPIFSAPSPHPQPPTFANSSIFISFVAAFPPSPPSLKPSQPFSLAGFSTTASAPQFASFQSCPPPGRLFPFSPVFASPPSHPFLSFTNK
jgi:hypothetical protein